ncbi:MAG: hypothetical protein SCALA702_26990 [Melioribacteraceae bacterium]|nr:MAG: hypothetical protein SCALA702_26990 [Melioribacteraceae bacterium]
MLRGRYSGKNSGVESPVISNFNKKLEFLQIVEKHTDYYILKTSRGYYKAVIPEELNVFDIVVVRVINSNPLKLNLTDLSGYSNSSNLADYICKKLKIKKPVSNNIVKFLLINKQIVSYDTILSLTKKVDNVNFETDLDFYISIYSGINNFLHTSFSKIAVIPLRRIINTFHKADIIFPRISKKIQFNEDLQHFLLDPDKYLKAKITGTVFDDIYVNDYKKMIYHYLTLMKKQEEHIIPYLYNIEGERSEYSVLFFISGGFPKKILTILYSGDRPAGSFILSNEPELNLLADSELFYKIGQFCATEQKSQLPKTSLLDNLNGYASELFKFDMSLFEDVFNSDIKSTYTFDNYEYPEHSEVERSLSAKMVTVYIDVVKNLILGGVL